MALTTDQMNQLLDSVRAYLNINWPDENRDARLRQVLLAGMAYIDSLMPAPLDYTIDGEAQSLLLIYVMYDESHAADDFGKNYAARIDTLKWQEEVRAYRAAQEDSEGSDLS